MSLLLLAEQECVWFQERRLLQEHDAKACSTAILPPQTPLSSRIRACLSMRVAEAACTQVTVAKTTAADSWYDAHALRNTEVSTNTSALLVVMYSGDTADSCSVVCVCVCACAARLAGLLKPQGPGKSMFPTLRKALRLIVTDQEPQLSANLTDVSQLHKGYTPISIRLVEAALKGGWGPITEPLSLLPGAMFDTLQVSRGAGCRPACRLIGMSV